MKNPIVKLGLVYFQNQSAKALAVPQTVESAVLPIYHPPNFKRKPVQIGSGVIVKIMNEYFIFSASHIFDEIGSNTLLIGDGTGSPIQSLSGDRFSSGKGESGTHSDDPIDASVFHIQSHISESLKKAALTLDDFDFSDVDSETVFIAAGFRIKKSNTAGNIVRSKREGFSSVEIFENEYSRKKINSETHVALRYEDQILLDGHWKTSPTPKGFSGGAIIRIDGVSVNIRNYDKPVCKQLLTGIIIEQRRGRKKDAEVIIGTRIYIHLLLIKHFLMELEDEISRYITFS